jgi:hypothetical protein
MRLHVLLVLLGLRYRLLWAQVRLRRGKIAFFFIGYLLACFVGTALLVGGFGAATASIRLGQAELLARIVLGGFSGIAIVAALLLGIGVNPAFRDAVLRRYPLPAGDRFLTRRLTAFLDPLWMILLALFVGLAAGFHAAGVGSIWLAVPASLLLVTATYLFAQLLAGAVEWITATQAGLTILAVLAVILVFAVSAAPAMGANPSLLAALLPVMKATPAFCAAAVMAGGPAMGLLLLLVWCVALAAAIAGVERLPMPSRRVAAARAEWDGHCDRLAAHFGSSAPLVAKTLKYYWRTKRGRLGFLLNGPVFPLMLVIIRPDRNAPLLHFFIGLGLMAIIGFSVTFAMAVNSFGFDGSGFRRYFLLPLPPTEVVKAVSLVPLVLGALTLPMGFVACVLLARVPVDSRMAAMLVANGVGGLCFFQALALWTSMLAPSRTDGAVRFGNDYSFAANVVTNGGMLVTFFGSQFLGLAVGARVLQFWWTAPVFMVAAVVFYVVSFRMAPAVLLSRRERILAVVERGQESGRLIT